MNAAGRAKVNPDQKDVTERRGRGEDAIIEAHDNWEAHGWDGGPHRKAALSIVRAEQLVREAAASVLGKHRLTYARHETLALLYFSRAGEMPMGSIGRHLMVHPTRVSSTIGFLEKAGYVERLPDPGDRRIVLARITEEGRRVMGESTAALLGPRFNLSALSDAEAEGLFAVLRKVRVAAGDLER